jgi:RNA polymerase sigma factor (sigma-70 family)
MCLNPGRRVLHGVGIGGSFLPWGEESSEAAKVSTAASSRKSLSTFSARCPVEVMPSRTGTDPSPAPLESLVRGERAEALRRQLAARYPDSSADSIEDAIQNACQSFLDEADGITAPGQVYTWLRTAALRNLNREADRHRREVAVDPSENGIEAIAADASSGPAEELIALEDDADLAMLVEKVSSSLTDRQRDVLALYGAGLKRPQIAARLGLPERDVKEQLRLIFEKSRAVLANLSGGGCKRGEPMVMRFICGVSTTEEAVKAREHLSHCGRCNSFSERLIAWREKAGAMLPAPVAEGADPGVVRRFAESASDKLSALKQHVLDSGAQVKQHATATYYRAVDPTPLAAARPGTAAAVVASCIAIGGGAATYCVHEGVDPLGAAQGLIASSPDSEPTQTSAPPEAETTGPTYTPAEATTTVEEPEPTPEPQPAPDPQPKPEPKAEPEPEPEPAPEDNFEPVTPAYQSSETESESSYEATEAAPAAEPAPTPANSGPQFGGP